MLDRDLADLYEVETKQLKRAVRRNMNRFPIVVPVQVYRAQKFILELLGVVEVLVCTACSFWHAISMLQ